MSPQSALSQKSIGETTKKPISPEVITISSTPALKKNKIFEVSSFSGEGIPELIEEIHRYLDVKDNIFR